MSIDLSENSYRIPSSTVRQCKSAGRPLTPDVGTSPIGFTMKSRRFSLSCPSLNILKANLGELFPVREETCLSKPPSISIENPQVHDPPCDSNSVHGPQDQNESEILHHDSQASTTTNPRTQAARERPINRFMTCDVKPHDDASFDNLKLNSEILRALEEKGWKWPSPIQDEAIPSIMSGRNVIARSKNGTGKTGAYAVALLNKINVKKPCQVIILVPTRELALQTANVCISIAKHQDGLNVMVATGGTELSEDILRLMNRNDPVHVVVGSPKRVYDLVKNRVINPDDVCSVVFDEADKLLCYDFEETVTRLMNLLPEKCQKILVSATFPINIKPFVTRFMDNCVQCNLMNELTLKGVTQFYAYLKEDQKISCLRQLLDTLDIKQSIIFCNSGKRVELLAKKMMELGFPCYYIHSKMNQQYRNKVFHDFRVGLVTHLICTDLMTRGIDVPLVNVVFNFDFPNYADTYLHRIGRAGRFGHLAIAVNFITDYDKEHVADIGKQLECKIFAIPKEIDKRLYVASFQIQDE